MKTKLLIIVMTIFLFSCSENKKKEKVISAKLSCIKSENSEGSIPPPPPPPPASLESFDAPKLIKTGEIKIRTTEVEETKNLLKQILIQCQGTVSHESLSNYEDDSYYNLLFSVPVANFEIFISKLESSHINITEKTYRTTDVTLQYVDEVSRLRNKKKLEQTYLDLLSKTDDITSIIEIQSKIEEIRSDIESKESQLKILENQISLSEISIEIETPELFKKREELAPKYTDKLNESIKIGLTSISDTILYLLSIWPMYALAGFLFIGYKIYKRKRNKQLHKTNV